MDAMPVPPLAETFRCAKVTPDQFDLLLALGWRHFGTEFFRYNYAFHDGRIALVQPLRLPVGEFRPNKSFRRILAKNQDLTVQITPPVLDDVRRGLFLKHRTRFTENIPPSLESFLGSSPSAGPTSCVEIGLYHADGRLLAASWLDQGRESASSLYGMFDPAESARSLGLCTMLEELRYAREQGFRYYYPGYAYHLPSPYDYKKRFSPLEAYDWIGEWKPLHPAP